MGLFLLAYAVYTRTYSGWKCVVLKCMALQKLTYIYTNKHHWKYTSDWLGL